MIDESKTNEEWPPLSPIRTGVRGRCPRCGKGHLFQGFLKLRRECEICHLDYSFADPADGPAFFVICFFCVPAVFFAVWLDYAYAPPLWVHLVTSLPVLLISCILPLRPLKGWLVASQYFYKAEEGRFAASPRESVRGPDVEAKSVL
ncbi:DUF983 domain-containing protein [Methylocella tundrae]|uniref:DUF983 domain-containing protein n=1 Tax=Methylocella tundrae TaxID=227605 RepID=A0A4U8Z2C0_METTU|nr:DUF983 domain-containing protein [Methylocella tundrae]WPP03382.1 DUF983 domain-containing protein [Methylocella tundrae]VFU09430.1 conserved protein of unknown function [Methylocella tundrae]